MTLYEISEEITNCIDPETGEVDAEKLEALEMLRDEKIENIALWIKDLEAEIEALKCESKNMLIRAKERETKINNLGNYLNYILGGKKYMSVNCDISFRKSESVEIIDEKAIPQEFFRTRVITTVSPDKIAIKNALNQGKKVVGAKLKNKINCSVR